MAFLLLTAGGATALSGSQATSATGATQSGSASAAPSSSQPARNGGTAAPRNGSVPANAGRTSAVLSSAALPSTGRLLQRFAPTYMSKTGSHPYSQADAVLIANNYDLVVASSKQFTSSTLSAMKTANPNVRVLVYLNGSFDMVSNTNPPTTYPAAQYARDAKGKYIESTKYHNWAMDVGSSAWATTVSQLCDGLLASATYDGCFVDMLGDSLLSGSYLTSQPINPATNKVWTTQERMTATTAIGQRVTSDHSGKIIMGNGLHDGTRYYDSVAPTSQLLNGVSPALAETWIRQANQSVNAHRALSDWQKDVDMLGDIAANGNAAAVTTKLWITAKTAEVTAWHRYAVASFLLGAAGSTYFSFTKSQGATELQTDATDPLDHTVTGAAVGPYKAQGAVFTRQFVKVQVIVNPTGSSATANVSSPCVTLDGKSVSTSLTILAYSGEICAYGSGGPPPTVTKVQPNTGPAGGGTVVTITGTGFTSGSAVAFGTTAASSVKVVSGTQITATSPAGSGTVDVIVTTAGGPSATSSQDQFTYAPVPTVSGVSPSAGPLVGGTSVTITGTGFTTSGTTVAFGTTAASPVKVVSGTQITATSPAGSGTVDVIVTTGGGPSATSSQDQFTYAPVPTVTSVTQNSGLAAGGYNVVIAGTGFTGATAVDFGTNPGTSAITVNNDSSITVTVPAAGSTGPVDVTVTTPGGTSLANPPGDQFTYI